MIVVGNVPVISWREQATFQWDDVCFVIDLIVSLLASSVVDREFES
jgi:hypothetical protein